MVREVEDEQVRSTYQYVVNLRNLLEQTHTSKIAHENHKKVQVKQKNYHDKLAESRKFKVGDCVRVATHQ